MKAFVIKEYAHPSKLQLTWDAPEPVLTPGSDEHLINVHSAGLNFFDVRLAPTLLILYPSHSLAYGIRKIDTTVARKVPDAAAAPVRAWC